ncbi:MAG TPA: hypothetical protein VK278_01850 [Gaiellaceae bacterium]|nr:hypothetical protein [Gaiellaceae bacterium]
MGRADAVALFEREGVKEWLYGLVEEDGDERIRAALDEVLGVRPGDRLSDACVECALAAAEVVATCAGAHADEPPPLVTGYAEDCGVPSDELLATAFQAVQRIALEPELRDIEVVDLEQRLASVAA